jgi:hypothetical protein
VLAALTPAQWALLFTTLCTGIGTVLAGIAAIRRAKAESRTEAEIDCLNRLKVARLEAESLADELHELRKRR